ncbi:MAG: GH92 family glycosyl hydrolase, partial [Bacteroidales bacterium]|nr:GH92 family glycosyl hydrolase [Bacteroidales bacterium]
GDFINTFLHQYKNGGKLPVWELAGNYTGCMIGYHSVSVIADAYVKGLRNFDADLALEAMKHSAMSNKLGLKYYKQYGYIPSEKEAESVSKTLEYAYDDWCIAQMAKQMKCDSNYQYFIQRAQNYKNIYNSKTRFMAPKYYGVWKYPFDPKEVDFNFTEANSWQYSFYVPQDIQGLISLMGGNGNFSNQLDLLFAETSETTGRQQADITGLIGQYAHGNEPSHHIAYLYDYCGQPWKTQQRVHQICNEMYSESPDGLAGNEDCGQMSSWFVLGSLGFYQVTPGSPYFAIGTPRFKKTVVNLESGKQFTVIAENLSSENFYIQKMQLNGNDYNKFYLNYNDIVNGGELIFVMSNKPNKLLGVSIDSAPPSAVSDNLILPTPYNNVKRRMFTDSVSIKLFSIIPGTKIFYSENESDSVAGFKKYVHPLLVPKTTRIRYFARKEGYSDSKTGYVNLYKFPTGRSIRLKYPPHPQYTGGSDSALIDGIIANDNFRLGGWQGFYGVDLDAVIDLGKPMKVTEISADFLQDVNSWIFMPEYVLYEFSVDGKSFIPLSKVKNPVAEDDWTVIRNGFTSRFYPKKIRYIHIVGKTKKYCPEWHKGHGNQLFIFCDEITIK